MSDDITGVRILIIDDSSTHVAVCRKLLLTAGVDPYFIYEAQSVKQAKKTIKDTPPDICFIDYILPDGLGSEVLDFIQLQNQKQEPLSNQIISVVMTGAGNEKLVASLFRKGAIDYLMKHDFIDRFLPAVQRAVAFYKDSVRQKELSFFDPTTKLLNRTAFLERANQILEDHYRKNQICALIFIDLDGFKDINDTYGHSAGDIYLKAAADRIQDLCRSTDLAGRFGGDEFVVLLRDISKCDLILKVDKWMKGNSSLHQDIFLENEFRCSLGVAISNQEKYQSLDDFICAADHAMYGAKKSGKNKYTFIGTQQLIVSENPISDLAGPDSYTSPIYFLNALLNNEFMLYFQPVRDVNTLEIKMLEALVRWPEMPEDMTVEFVFNSISRFDLYDQFHEWFIPKLFEVLDNWKREGCAVSFALNAPSSKKGCESLIRSLQSIMKERDQHIFESTCFYVEMNESLLNEDSSYIHDFQNELTTMNIACSLDQFSRSETKLANLIHRKFDHMKIRRCDFDQINDEEYESVLKISSFLRLSLGCHLIAVGVESEQDFNRVKQAGADKVQGYYLGRPMVADKPWKDFISQYSLLEELRDKES